MISNLTAQVPIAPIGINVGFATLRNFASVTNIYQAASALIRQNLREEEHTMTKVQICIFAWAVLGLVGAAILLYFGELGDERYGENRD